MTKEVVSRRAFLHASAGFVAAGSAGLAGYCGEPDTCSIRITFSGLCYLCTPPVQPPAPRQSYVLLPRCGKGTKAGSYGQVVTSLHQAALYYDVAQEDPKAKPGKFFVRVSLERWWLSLPRFSSGAPNPPALPQGFPTLQTMLGVQPSVCVLPDYTKPLPPTSIASHVWFEEGQYENEMPTTIFDSFNGQPVTLPYKAFWDSPQTTAPVHGLEIRPYHDYKKVPPAYALPPLRPLKGCTSVALFVLNVPADEEPGSPPKDDPPADYCASHYAAFYDLLPNPTLQVGSPTSPKVPCCPEINKFGGTYTCMISGGG